MESIRTLYNIYSIVYTPSIVLTISLFFAKIILHRFEEGNDTFSLENFAHWKISFITKFTMILKIRVSFLQKSFKIYCFFSRSYKTFPRLNLEDWSLVNFLKVTVWFFLVILLNLER